MDSTSIVELGNNYEEVTYTRTSWEPESHHVTLQYRKPNGGRTMVWSYVGNIVINNEVAVFEARVDYIPRLFAVKGLEMPLDITDEILWRWSKESGTDFGEVLKTASINSFTLKTNGDKLCFEFGMWKHPNSSEIPISLDWVEIAAIMNEVRTNGIIHKTSVYGKNYKYLAKEFKPEIQK